MKIKDILKDDNINEKKLALEQVLNLSIPEILLNKEKELKKLEEIKIKKVIKKINKGIPIQYILKKAYFYNNPFYVNKNVLIPRPETEYLVEETNNLINKKFKNKRVTILEIGTGSGIISITLNLLDKNRIITATDISKKALKVAKKNQKIYKTNISLMKTDIYKGIKNKFDILISNPPYIEENTPNIEEKVKKHEPNLALFAKNNGYYFYEEMIKNIKKIINEEHIIAFEIGDKQGEKIKKMLKKHLKTDDIIIKKDYNGYERYIYSISKKKDKEK